MDRSFLSDDSVVAASRSFVCIRALTYESKSEGEFLANIFRGRGGELENSVFAILDPSGKKITRGGRSPGMVFGGPTEQAQIEAMVTKMMEIAKRYPGTDSAAKQSLPYLADLRRGLNAASCDLQPLVVVADVDSTRLAALEESVATLAWSAEFVGAFAFARVTDFAELTQIGVVGAESGGIFVVAPDAYGLEGKVLAHADGPHSAAIAAALRAATKSYEARAKDSRKHIRKGMRTGKKWEPETPVTDPHHPKETGVRL
ncbi:MAG: thioredoxin family protein [Planctomycetota bacterium]